MKQIEIVCPCCSTQLLVDVLTQRVMRATASRDVDEATGKPKLDESRWDSAQRRVSDRSASVGDKLDAGLERERARAARLDDLFREAQKKVDPQDEGDA